MKKLLLALLVVVAFPAAARAGNVALTTRDIPLGGARSLAGAAATPNFNMLAVHWRGNGTVLYRTQRLRGGWRAWREVDDDVRPNDASPEQAATRGWHNGNLDWAGASDRAQFRTRGGVRRLRAYYLWSRVTAPATRRLSLAGAPAIVPRSGWLADEKIKRAQPTFAPQVKVAVVHHTAGTNNYTRAQAAAIVRGIEVYHVKGNGWNDIGYNFLVDRFGTVYEGRYGGIERNVIGAHAEGFNNGTVGVSLIGNYSSSSVKPPAVQQDALVQVLAWRLDVAHVDPLSTVVYTSGGNAKFRAGRPVTLRAISGHRDTGPSECPGNGAYATIGRIAAQVSQTGLPKLYTPVVSGALGGRIRFQARFSSMLPWTVTVADAAGTVVAQGKGRGALVDWAWDSPVSRKGGYTWTIDAGASVRPATGTLGVVRGGVVVVPGPLLTALTAAPAVVAPAADGSLAPATATYTLGAAARVKAQLFDSDGVAFVTLLDARRPAGTGTIAIATAAFPDGRYKLQVTASAAATTQTRVATLVVDRTLVGLAEAPAAISPNGDGIFDTATFSFSLARPVPVRLQVRRSGVVVATPFDGTLETGPHVLGWDGTNAGVRVPDGPYAVTLTVNGSLGEVTQTLPVAVDTTAPLLALLELRQLRFQLSEPAQVTVLVNGTTRVEKAAPLGIFTVPWLGAVTSVSAQAQDAAGNSSPIVKSP